MSTTQYLVIFAKAPQMGSVKTRLAKGIGDVAATGFYRQQTTDLVRRMSSDPRWKTVVAVTPDSLAEQMNDWKEVFPPHVPRIGQGGGNLGDRMNTVFQSLPPGPTIIVGSDIPAISPSHIAEAFQALGSHDVVVGPSDDGGYWLVGQKRRPRILQMFEGVRWSSKHTLTDTLESLPASASHARVTTLNDIDTVEDYVSFVDGS